MQMTKQVSFRIILGLNAGPNVRTIRVFHFHPRYSCYLKTPLLRVACRIININLICKTRLFPAPTF